MHPIRHRLGRRRERGDRVPVARSRGTDDELRGGYRRLGGELCVAMRVHGAQRRRPAPRHARRPAAAAPPLRSSLPSSRSQAKVRARAVGLLPRLVFSVVDARQHGGDRPRGVVARSAIGNQDVVFHGSDGAVSNQDVDGRGARREAERRRREDRGPEAHVAGARPDLGLGRRPLVRVDGDDAGLAVLPVQPRGPARAAPLLPRRSQ